MLAVFGDETNLSKDTQECISEKWSANDEYTGVDCVGFVSEEITAVAVKSEIPGGEVESFSDPDAAVDWARG